MEFFKLPLNPIDLTRVYEEKMSLIPIDYLASKEQLGVKQSLIYISNTQFEVMFSEIDNELLSEFIKLDFYVNSPQLVRVLKTCLDLVKGIDISNPGYNHKDVVDILTVPFFQSFVFENKQTLEEIINFLKSLPSYILVNSIEFIEEEDIKETLNNLNIELIEDNKELPFGVNIVNSLPILIDLFLETISEEDFSLYKNNIIFSSIMNENPKYSGADFLGKLDELGYINIVMGLILGNEEEA